MSTYARYISERLVVFVATILISITIVFFVPRLVPGDPISAVLAKLGDMCGNMGNAALVQEYMRRFGLDRPLPEQYLAYMAGLARGDMGYSIASFPTTVGDLLRTAIPW